jgi:hypothetical protein
MFWLGWPIYLKMFNKIVSNDLNLKLAFLEILNAAQNLENFLLFWQFKVSILRNFKCRTEFREFFVILVGLNPGNKGKSIKVLHMGGRG